MNRKNGNKARGLPAKTESFIFTSQFLSVHTSYLTLSCLITTRAWPIKERVGKEEKKQTHLSPWNTLLVAFVTHHWISWTIALFMMLQKIISVVIPSPAKNILIYLRVRKWSFSLPWKPLSFSFRSLENPYLSLFVPLGTLFFPYYVSEKIWSYTDEAFLLIIIWRYNIGKDRVAIASFIAESHLLTPKDRIK